MTPDLRQENLEPLTAAAVRMEPSLQVTDCRDPKDNKYLKYLELALEARADVIVPSDGDLLVLEPWRGVRILRPANSWRCPDTASSRLARSVSRAGALLFCPPPRASA